MIAIDWIVLFSTLLCIVLYGIYKSRNQQTMDNYLLAGRSLPWYHVGLSVMATQASAITFLSAPGQAFSDGMRFVQFYFGLPLAMIVLCITFVPIFHRLKVYTAYEFLEQRFDLKTRAFTAILFLIQRGLSTGITIYAPSIILSTILGISIIYTTLIIGILVIIYTVYGGSKAVSYTHLLQMFIIIASMFLAGYLIIQMLPAGLGFTKAIKLSAEMGKMNTIDTHFDLKNKYNIWSGLIGGFFLALSYFGTDQSQVGRYLSGGSVKESRQGLIMNGILKIPMQYMILLIGVLLFVFYQFQGTPLFFNKVEIDRIHQSEYAQQYNQFEIKYDSISVQKKMKANELVIALNSDNSQIIAEKKNEFLKLNEEGKKLREESKKLMLKNSILADTDDSNYVFLNFVTTFLPHGIIGLLIAIIFLAAMGSTASGLNALSSTSVIDIYKRMIKMDGTDHHYYLASRWLTVFWGIFAMITAFFASKLGNLIEAVNILGSLFYGTILGIFIVAFYFKKVKSNAVFSAAIIAEILVIGIFLKDWMAFLWLNVIGCLLVVIISLTIQDFLSKETNEA